MDHAVDLVLGKDLTDESLLRNVDLMKGGSLTLPSVSALLLLRLSATTISYLAPSSATHVWEPMNPAPPVTRMLIE